jgi:hypothetical protein
LFNEEKRIDPNAFPETFPDTVKVTRGGRVTSRTVSADTIIGSGSSKVAMGPPIAAVV